MTVGASRPVVFSICTNLRASSAKSFNAAGADVSCFDASFSYRSKYIRIVAPEDPVPLSLKTTRAGSPDGNWKFSMSPCLDVLDPSTGSV